MTSLDRWVDDCVRDAEARVEKTGFAYRYADAATVRNIDERNVLADVVAMTDRLAADGMVFEPEGIRADSEFYTLGVCGWNHDYSDPRTTLGRLRGPARHGTRSGHKTVECTIQLLDLESALMPRADVLTLADAGLLRWSVGIVGMEGRAATPDDPEHYRGASYVVTSMNWRELSGCTLPIDSACETTGVTVSDRSVQRFADALSDGTISQPLAARLGIQAPPVVTIL